MCVQAHVPLYVLSTLPLVLLRRGLLLGLELGQWPEASLILLSLIPMVQDL